MRILIIGKNGQLGKSFKLFIEKNISTKRMHQFTFVGRESFDLEKQAQIDKFFSQNEFDLVINCSAYTKVENAEIDAEKAYRVNQFAVGYLAKLASLKSFKLMHFSTDYVFDGLSIKPYTESDKPNPNFVYGKSKYLGELSIIEEMKHNSIIIRCGWIYSKFRNNFINSMIEKGLKGEKLRIVSDQVGTPLYVNDLIRCVFEIISTKDFQFTNFKTQIYHLSNYGECSWYDFACYAFNVLGLKNTIIPISTKDSGARIDRPAYSVLDKSKIVKDFELVIPDWKISLEKYLCKQYKFIK